MIKEALQYIAGMGSPNMTEINGETYSDKELFRICHNPKAEPVKMATLKSLVDYIKSGTDVMPGKMFIHVTSPLHVKLYSQLDSDREREYMAEVNAGLPYFPFDTFISHEKFIIKMQSAFAPGNDRELVLKFAGTVESGTVASYGDDGVSQKATVKTGVASKSDALVPNPVRLKPYRTFMEAGQPESSFIFRMAECKNEGVQCALFEADGGAWKLEAVENIKKYLEHELEGMEQFTVIA